MKDFTEERSEALEFKIDDDVFYATGDLPGGMIGDLGAIMTLDDSGEKLRVIMEFLDRALLPDSAVLFAERMRDSDNPITFNQALAIFEWLIETLTENVRPTQAPSSSQRGRRSTGTRSMVRSRSEDTTSGGELSQVL